MKSEILSKSCDKPPAALDYNWIIVEPAVEAENVLKPIEGSSERFKSREPIKSALVLDSQPDPRKHFIIRLKCI